MPEEKIIKELFPYNCVKRKRPYPNLWYNVVTTQTSQRRMDMTQLNININMEELTEAVLNSNINSMMKSMAVLVF
ncbi:hypothetical protein B1O48_16905, partial [Listeria monocytogenes]|nr:hypothetical protein [Listeria monocytogenes]